MRLGPDTSALIQLPFQHYGGYSFADTHISGFSHTHLVGAGVADFGNFGIIPTTKGPACFTEECYKSAFSHDTEIAIPGVYSVFLEGPSARATLAATGTHSGMHSYVSTQGSAGNDSTLLLDVCHNAMADAPKACRFASASVACLRFASGSNSSCLTAQVAATVHMKGSLSGRANGGYLPIHMHAVVTASSTGAGGGVSLAVGGWRAGLALPATTLTTPGGANTTSGSLGVTLQALTASPVSWSARAGISFVSPALAKANLLADQCTPPGRRSAPLDMTADCLTFEQASNMSASSWATHFAKLQAPPPAPGTPPYSWTLLASAWYRAAQAPTTYSESNGQYPAFTPSATGAVGTVPSGVRALSDMSLWDIHRTQAPLMTLSDPRAALDTVWSLVNAWRTGGNLPVWPLANVYTGCMIGSHGVPVLADVALKLGCAAMAAHGVTCADAFAAANASVSEKAAKLQLDVLGFVPQEKSKQGASHTLALSYDASAAAALGAAAGVAEADLAPLRALAGSYANTWSVPALRMCPRWANGTFQCGDPDIPYPFEHGFTEGGSNQWSWFVPGDVPGLISLWGGPAAAASNLSAIMQATPSWPLGNVLPNPFYWAGNEPDLLQIWLFNWMTEPAAATATAGMVADPPSTCHPHAPHAQLWAQWAMRSGAVYSIQPSGIPGNDDYGTMAAWAVWATLGLYPVTGTPLYTLGAPQLPELTLQLDGGASLRVVAHNWTDVAFPQSKSAATPGVATPSPRALRQLQECVAVAAEAVQPVTAHAKCTQTFITAHDKLAAAAEQYGGAGSAGDPAVSGNAFVQSVSWNGQRLTSPFLRHADVSQGGVLEFSMGPQAAPGAFCVRG